MVLNPVTYVSFPFLFFLFPACIFQVLNKYRTHTELGSQVKGGVI